MKERKIEFLNKKQKKKLIEKYKDKIPEIPENVELIKIGKKIYGYTGSLNKQEILALMKIARVESIGLYLFTIKK